MRSPLACCARLVYRFALIFVLLQTGFASERGPRVEVVCPKAPAPVKLADRQILVYELHVTNFDTVPLTLKRLEIFTSTDKSAPLKTISDNALSAIVSPAGSMGGTKESTTIAPGKRAIIFLWIEEELGQRQPTSLKHRMVFAAGVPGDDKAAPSSETVLEDFSVPIDLSAAPLLGSPFPSGVWFASDLANDSNHRRSLIAIDGYVHAPERFAIDWIKVGPNGDSHHDEAARNENWWGYGEPIHAVADGDVTQVLDGISENTPRVLPTTTLENIAGNYVIVRIAPNRYVTFAHLQHGSVKVRPGDHVHKGDVLGLLGNSGNSTAPHLHFQVTDGNSVLQSEGVPFVLEKFTDLGPGSDYEPAKHLLIPRELSIPGNNAVVEFGTTEKTK